MKKLAAILLLFIFLFNLVGYRFVFNYAQQQADAQLESSLDKNQYNNSDLISITVPLSMPYQTAQSNWERVNGEVNVNGKIYKYVKRRMVDGEMVLLCLPDQNKMRIQNAKDDFFKTANDIAQNNAAQKNNGSKAEFFKTLTSDYEQHTNLYNFALWGAASLQHALYKSGDLLFSPHTPPVQPPDAI